MKPGDSLYRAKGPERGEVAFSAAGSGDLNLALFTPDPVSFYFLSSSLSDSDFKQESAE